MRIANCELPSGQAETRKDFVQEFSEDEGCGGREIRSSKSQFPSLLVEQNPTGKSGKAQAGAAFEVCAGNILPEFRST